MYGAEYSSVFENKCRKEVSLNGDHLHARRRFHGVWLWCLLGQERVSQEAVWGASVAPHGS